MTIVKGTHGGYETDTAAASLLLMKPMGQVTGTLEEDHIFEGLCVKTGVRADFTIKIVPLQTRLVKVRLNNF